MSTVSKDKFLNALGSIIEANSDLSKEAVNLLNCITEKGLSIDIDDYEFITFNLSIEEDEEESTWAIYFGDDDLFVQSDSVPSRDPWWSLMVELDKHFN